MAEAALIASLLAEARDRAARLGADADARVAELRARAASAEAARRQEHAHRISSRHAETSEAVLGAVESECRRQVLEARARLLERVRAEAERRTATADERPAFVAGLASLVEAALRAVGDREAVVRCRAPLVAAVRAVTDLEVRADLGVSGLVVETTDGRLVVDATLGARLAASFPARSRRVLDALWGGT